MYYLYNFVIYSILGYIFETIVAIIGGFSLNSGFMYGPYTIVYGIGVVLTFSMFNKFKSIKPTIKKILIMFVSSFILLTLLELTGGILLKEIYNISLWNYKGLTLNLGKYISLEISIAWGILSILIYLYLKPLTDKLIKKIPNFIIIGILIIMFVDFVITTTNAFL